MCPVFDYHKLVSPPEVIAWSDQGCRTAGIGCLDCKQAMADGLVKLLSPIQQRRRTYEEEPQRAWQVLEEGRERARSVARATIQEAHAATPADPPVPRPTTRYGVGLPRAGKLMESFWTAFFGVLAAAWIIGGLRMARGMARVPRLGRCPAAAGRRLSGGYDPGSGAERSCQAAPGSAHFARPGLSRSEVIVVNDRSSDATGAILEEFASQNENLKVHHLRELPAGWLGKPMRWRVGYQHATGEWLVFTDADVCFAPDLLRRALALAREKDWDHLTLLPMVDLEGFWEKSALSFWGMGLIFGSEAWRVSDPRSRSYLGVGAFQLLRRSAYEAIGTHRRLALEVVDDMKLGKLVKLSRLRSGVAVAGERLRLRWQEGVAQPHSRPHQEYVCRLRLSRPHCRGASVAGLRL